jgi:hypothetical protein
LVERVSIFLAECMGVLAMAALVAGLVLVDSMENTRGAGRSWGS